MRKTHFTWLLYKSGKTRLNRDTLTGFFPIYVHFISFNCLIAQSEILSTLLSRNQESGLLLPVPDLGRGCFWFFSYNGRCNFLHTEFIVLKCVHSTNFFKGFFYLEGMLKFVKDLFCIYWYNHVISVFQSTYVLNCIDCLVYVELSLHPWY